MVTQTKMVVQKGEGEGWEPYCKHSDGKGCVVEAGAC